MKYIFIILIATPEGVNFVSNFANVYSFDHAQCNFVLTSSQMYCDYFFSWLV